jgi:hypothetical protein
MTAISTNKLSQRDFYSQIDAVLPKAEEDRLVAYPSKIFDCLARIPLYNAEKSSLESLKRKSGAQNFRLDQLKKWIREDKMAVISARESFKERCWTLYSHAYDGDLPAVLGSNLLRSDPEAIGNFGLISSHEHGCTDVDVIRRVQYFWLSSLGSPEPDAVLKRGSILCERYWSVLLNDVVVLGFVHSKRECHLWDAAPERPLSAPARLGSELVDIEFWDDRTRRVRVLAREIIMLHRAGYVQAAEVDEIEVCGRVFLCKSPEVAEAITLRNLFEEATLPFSRKKDSLESLDRMLKPKEAEGWGVVGHPKQKKIRVAASIKDRRPHSAAAARFSGGGSGGPLGPTGKK